MKKLAFITLIAAFAFGFNINNSFSQNLGGATINTQPSNSTSVFYDQTSESLIMRMVMATGQEEVGITLLDERGKTIHFEKARVHARGVVIEISMAGYENGNYTVQVKGTSFNFSQRFKKD